MRIEFTGGWIEFEPKLNESAKQYPDWLPDAAENHPEWAAAKATKATPPPAARTVVSLKDVKDGDVFFVVAEPSAVYRAIRSCKGRIFQTFGAKGVTYDVTWLKPWYTVIGTKDTQVVVIHNTEAGK
jgi:hypothetical protein